jgi:hypothetical protein
LETSPSAPVYSLSHSTLSKGNQDLFKDPEMLRRLKDINALPAEEKKCVLFNLDAVLRDAKTRKAYSAK